MLLLIPLVYDLRQATNYHTTRGIGGKMSLLYVESPITCVSFDDERRKLASWSVVAFSLTMRSCVAGVDMKYSTLDRPAPT